MGPKRVSQRPLLLPRLASAASSLEKALFLDASPMPPKFDPELNCLFKIELVFAWSTELLTA